MKIYKIVYRIIALLFILFVGCKTATESVPDKNPQYTSSSEGVVASSHPLATAAGVEMLEQGGNAVDAAVATAFTLAVVEPAMSGLGGRLQAIVRSADGELHGVDATTQAPQSYDPETAPQAKYGYAVIGVPGVVAGLVKLNEEHGKLPLNTVMQPAINIALNGFHQLPDQIALQERVKDMVLEFEGSRQYFILPSDTMPYGSANLLVQKDLAFVLQHIADNGRDGFYKGEIATKMVNDVQSHGGALTLESLENYEARDAEVLSGNYRGYDVHGLWMPSFGAITIEILQILENLPMAEFTNAEWASAVYQATKIAYEDRYKQTSLEIGDSLIRKEYAKEQAKRIVIGEAVGVNQIEEQGEKYLAYSNKLGHTTHLSAADKNGVIVSLTQSIGPIMGSRVATPGLGFLYAATLGGYLGPMQPGQRAASHISPMILTHNGAPYMGVGAAGGAKINSAIIQVICRVIDQHKNLYEAMEAPRVHPGNDGILVEVPDSLSWTEDDFNFLKSNGFNFEIENRPFYFGRSHAVMLSDGIWYGAADPDGEGSAAGAGNR